MAAAAEYFETGRKNKGLKCNGYVFKLHHQNEKFIHWKCTLCNRLKCRASVKTNKLDPNNVFVKNNEHNHGPEAYKKRFQRPVNVKSEMKIIINPAATENGFNNPSTSKPANHNKKADDSDEFEPEINFLEPETSIEIKQEPLDFNYSMFS